MNNNRTLITHMNTDPNAPKHAFIGMISTLVACFVGLYFSITFAALGATFASLLAGIGIECVQRLQRGHFQIKNNESIMDALTTWLWPIYYATRRIK